MSNYTIIGQIINTRGIRGEVKVLSLSTHKDRFKKLKEVFIGDELLNVNPKSVNVSEDFIYMSFVGLESINDVEKLKTKYIYVRDEDRVELEEGEYFISDIIGCEVYKTDGTLIGEVVDLIENPANDVYVVRGKKDYLIPQVSEFVKSIDIINKKIMVEPIEGMLD